MHTVSTSSRRTLLDMAANLIEQFGDETLAAMVRNFRVPAVDGGDLLLVGSRRVKHEDPDDALRLPVDYYGRRWMDVGPELSRIAKAASRECPIEARVLLLTPLGGIFDGNDCK